MQVTLFFHETVQDFADRAAPARREAYMGAWTAYAAALRQAGILRGGNALLPANAGVAVKLRDGAAQVLDGPYAETKEQLGGYMVLDVADMDAAIAWAARCPCAATGAVEVRPVLAMGSD